MWITRNKSHAVFLCYLLLMLIGVIMSQPKPRQATYFQPIPDDGEYCNDEILGVAQVWSYLECAGRCLRKRGCAKIYWFPSTSAAGTRSCHLARDGTCTGAATHREQFESFRLVHHTGPGQFPLVSSPVCFGARDDTFGEFIFRPETGHYKLKFVHTSGGVSCSTSLSITPFGCLGHGSLMVLTDSATNAEIVTRHEFDSYEKQGEAAPVLATKSCHQFTQNESYRIWYSEDLYAGHEANNHGTSCVLVYAVKSTC